MTDSLLAASLRKVGEYRNVSLKLFPNNRLPLGSIYNKAIKEASDRDVLIFIHDDVYIDDWMIVDRIDAALKDFDLLGVAGNRRSQNGQITWYLNPLKDNGSKFDIGWLAGAVSHGDTDEFSVTNYGGTYQEVRLLDGVLLAGKATVFKKSRIQFDTELGFHLYDLDFCDEAINAGLRIGVFDTAISHESSGNSINSIDWKKSASLYFSKRGY